MRYFPGYINPQKNELFSSWIIRLCNEHKINSNHFSKFYFNGIPIWNRDIDRIPSDDLINKLIELTPLNKSELTSMFLSSYYNNSYLAHSNTISNNNSNFLVLGINHRKRKNASMLFCPKCLQNKKPYYKKEWRLPISFGCIECSIELLDKCTFCQMHIAFHRNCLNKKDLISSDITLCSYCGKSLTACKAKKLSKIGFDIQKEITEVLVNGYSKYSQYGFLFFDVIRGAIKASEYNGDIWNRVQIAFINENSLHLITDDNRSIKYRRLFIIWFFQLIRNENKFQKVIKKYSLRYSDFSRFFTYQAYWFKNYFYHLT